MPAMHAHYTHTSAHAHPSMHCPDPHSSVIHVSFMHLSCIVQATWPSFMHSGHCTCITTVTYTSWPLYTHPAPHTCVLAFVHMSCALIPPCVSVPLHLSLHLSCATYLVPWPMWAV